MCASWWSRALSSATVTGDLTGTITAPLLAQIGRALIREGEALYLIEMRRGMAVLTPASAQWSEGSRDPERWGYSLTLNGPTSSVVARAPAEQVVHLRWAETPAMPWRGMSPLALAGQTARRAWATESRLADLAALNVTQRSLIGLKGAGEAVVESFADQLDDTTADGSAGSFVTNDEIGTEMLTTGQSADAADITGRARAWQSLVGAGYPPSVAAEVCGLCPQPGAGGSLHGPACSLCC